jgi:hypothetical protein
MALELPDTLLRKASHTFRRRTQVLHTRTFLGVEVAILGQGAAHLPPPPNRVMALRFGHFKAATGKDGCGSPALQGMHGYRGFTDK